ncbi:MAG: CinA family protein [Pseudomonadota bacterium]
MTPTDGAALIHEILAQDILARANERNWTIVTAESCTGGMIAAALTDTPGSSRIFEQGFVTYSNGAKLAMLGVTRAALDDHGAVSEPVAREMAQGAAQASGAQIAVAVTGIAGPGGSDVKPEGRVCFALSVNGAIHAQTVDFGALGRAQVRISARDYALDLILGALKSA